MSKVLIRTTDGSEFADNVSGFDNLYGAYITIAENKYEWLVETKYMNSNGTIRKTLINARHIVSIMDDIDDE